MEMPHFCKVSGAVPLTPLFPPLLGRGPEDRLHESDSFALGACRRWNRVAGRLYINECSTGREGLSRKKGGRIFSPSDPATGVSRPRGTSRDRNVAATRNIPRQECRGHAGYPATGMSRPRVSRGHELPGVAGTAFVGAQARPSPGCRIVSRRHFSSASG